MVSGDFRLLVGLGNPGTKYTKTRHNVGFMALKKLAEKESVTFRQRNKLQGLLAEVGSGREVLRLLMPNTFMNESGRAIRATLDWFDIEVDQLLVLVDDMDLPLGRLRLRAQGGSGGHNGLKSTIQHLGTQNFYRLRIGIGAPASNPAERQALTNSHVLGTFSIQESQMVDQVLEEVVLGLGLIKRRGIERASTFLNTYKPERSISE